MSESELERAARKHRDQVAADDAEKARADAGRADRNRQVAATMIDTALMDGPGSVLRSLLVFGVFGAAAIAVFAKFHDAWQLAVGVIAALVGGGVVLWQWNKRVANGRRRQLRSIGRGFDADRYLGQLGEHRRTAHVIVTVGFARAWEPAAAEAALDAVLTWMPALARPTWAGTTLRLDSGELRCTERIHPKGSASVRVFTNAPIHRCLSDILRRVIPNVERTSPVTQLDVEVTGVVCPVEEVA